MANNYNSGTTYEIVCPFCFRRYSHLKALFVDNRQTSEGMYPEYAEYMRYFLNMEPFGGRKMPLYFQKAQNDGVPDQFAAVTETGDFAFERACPFCCNVIPAASGRVKPFSVTVIGSDDAERSFFIASALHRLNRDMQANFGASFIPADYRTAQMFYDQYEEPLYAEHIVPEAAASITPLIYEFVRTGAAGPEEWKGSTVTYNNALIYIYNIDKDLVDRYPMIAHTAIAQSNGIVFIADAEKLSEGSEAVTDPWLGYLTETLRKIFGVSAVDKPAAIVLGKADKTDMRDKKWAGIVKAAVGENMKKTFPAPQYAKYSERTVNILKSAAPGYQSAIEALFAKDSLMYFPMPEFFEQHEDGTADIREPAPAEIPLLWLLSKFSAIPAATGTVIL